MGYRYFWVRSDGRVVEITVDDYARYLGSFRLLVAFYRGRSARVLTFSKRGIGISVSVVSLLNILDEVIAEEVK